MSQGQVIICQKAAVRCGDGGTEEQKDRRRK